MYERLCVASMLALLVGCSSSTTSPYFDNDGGTSSGGGSGGLLLGPTPPAKDGGSSGGSSSGGSSSGGSSSGGLSSSSGGSVNTQACGFNSTGHPTCDSCIVQSCCDVTKACTGNQDCVALIKCVSACAHGDQACSQSCEQQYPNGDQAAVSFVNCVNGQCKTPCSY